MGTVGPGSIHLLNGLYDAKKSPPPVLAICGQVPLAELGSDFFQEVDNDPLFADVAVFSRTVTSAGADAAACSSRRSTPPTPDPASPCSPCPATSARWMSPRGAGRTSPSTRPILIAGLDGPEPRPPD